MVRKVEKVYVDGAKRISPTMPKEEQRKKILERYGDFCKPYRYVVLADLERPTKEVKRYEDARFGCMVTESVKDIIEVYQYASFYRTLPEAETELNLLNKVSNKTYTNIFMVELF